jgi:hypothetical protein
VTLVAERIDLNNIPEFTLRKDDAMECLAAGLSPEMAVRRSVAGANAAYAHYIDGDLVCLWGYRWEDYRSRKAIMWLLSTEAADRHRQAFGRASRHMLDVLQVELWTITILVHNKYETAIKWLEWLGFKRSQALTESFTEMKKEKL